MYVDELVALDYSILIRKLTQMRNTLFNGDSIFSRDFDNKICSMQKVAHRYVVNQPHIGMFTQSTKKAVRVLDTIINSKHVVPEKIDELQAMRAKICSLEIMAKLTAEVK